MKKPIVFFDLETTGLSQTKDRIVEMYMRKKDDNGEIHEFYSRFNPFPVEISEMASSVHGITAEDVANEPRFEEKSQEILDFIKDCDLGGYNILNFDLPLLFEEFIPAGKMLDYRKHRIFDAYRMWTHYEPRTLTGATKRFLDRDLKDAHDERKYQIVSVHELENGSSYVDMTTPCDFGNQPYKYGYFILNRP